MGPGIGRMMYVTLGLGGLALALALGINPGFWLLLALCPLMMFLMMRSMAGMEAGDDHAAHGSEHDLSRRDDPTDTKSP
jgi:hypothetical protein